jgi:hypothetical protein
MRLDLNKLEVESFSTGETSPTPTPITIETGPDGPDSKCWICYETGNTVPSCAETCTFYYPCPLPDTPFPPCPVIT